jgi:hypothetical protein
MAQTGGLNFVNGKLHNEKRTSSSYTGFVGVMRKYLSSIVQLIFIIAGTGHMIILMLWNNTM